jgi:hypothetical protein
MRYLPGRYCVIIAQRRGGNGGQAHVPSFLHTSILNFISMEKEFYRAKISRFLEKIPKIFLGWIISFRDGKPFKVTFTGGLFFPGFEGKNEIIGMVRTYIGKTATECLVSDSVLFTVFTFPFFGHGTVH